MGLIYLWALCSCPNENPLNNSRPGNSCLKCGWILGTGHWTETWGHYKNIDPDVVFLLQCMAVECFTLENWSARSISFMQQQLSLLHKSGTGPKTCFSFVLLLINSHFRLSGLLCCSSLVAKSTPRQHMNFVKGYLKAQTCAACNYILKFVHCLKTSY